MAETVFNVHGMTCSGCAASVERAVSSLTGVRHVQVNLDAKMVKVDYDESLVDSDAIRTRMEDAGYVSKPA